MSAHTPGPCLRGPHDQTKCVKCLNAEVARQAAGRLALLDVLEDVLVESEAFASLDPNNRLVCEPDIRAAIAKAGAK